LVPDYDASDVAPTDEFSESSYKDLAEDAPWKCIRCTMPNSRLHPEGKRKFIRYGAITGDVKTYDAGNLFVTTTDGTAVSWAKLWIHYDVTLYTPQLPPGGVVALSNTLHITGTTQTTANGFPNQTVGVNSNTGIATVPVTGQIITFNVPGRFVVSYQSSATSSTVSNVVVSATGSLVTTYFDGVGFMDPGATTNNAALVAVVNVVAGTTVTFTNTVVAGANWDLSIVAMNTLAA
jgi:hypothetical protein